MVIIGIIIHGIDGDFIPSSYYDITNNISYEIENITEIITNGNYFKPQSWIDEDRRLQEIYEKRREIDQLERDAIPRHIIPGPW